MKVLSRYYSNQSVICLKSINFNYLYVNNSKTQLQSKKMACYTQFDNVILSLSKDSQVDKNLISFGQNRKTEQMTRGPNILQKEQNQQNAALNLSKKDWTKQQDKLVYDLHNQYGNKWAIISQNLKGRSDNCIKNHFYSRLRKGIRKINNIIEEQYKKSYKQFKVIDLYKIIQASDQKFKEVKSFTNEMTQLGYDLKNRLFNFAEEQDDQTQEYQQNVITLIKSINDFTKNYKRKSKKCRRYSPMGVDSVYRQNNKKSYLNTQVQQNNSLKNEQNQMKQMDQMKQQEIKVCKIQSKLAKKCEQKVIQKRITRNKKSKKHKSNCIEMNKQNIKNIRMQGILSLIQEPVLNNRISQQPILHMRISQEFGHFSDNQDDKMEEQLKPQEQAREEKLDNFVSNFLKTVKSYYSYKSIKSRQFEDDPFGFD